MYIRMLVKRSNDADLLKRVRTDDQDPDFSRVYSGVRFQYKVHF